MKKLLLIPALLFSGALVAQDYNYEVTPVVGYNIAEGNLNLENQTLYGAEFQYNGCDTFLKPELSVLFTDTDYEDLTPINPSTDIWRFAINGVRDFDSIGIFTPLIKVGIGYETLEKHLAENKDSVFFNAGAGVKTAITENIALKLEAVYMNKQTDSNLALLAGITFAFGQKAQPEAPVAPAPAPVDGDDDNDGVLNSKDKCPNTPAGTKVDSSGCTIDGDDDKDGVLNSKDKCPNTPAGTSVDSNGCKIVALTQVVKTEAAAVCPPKINLHINFKFDSAVIKEESKPRVNEFAEFLKCSPEYKTNIIGHTDSSGSDAYNLKLSERRANAVKDMIVKYGISADRVSTTPKGETEPVATNKTSEGRAQNRRIEAELIEK